MSIPRKRVVLWAPLVLVLLCAVAFAQGVVQESYRTVRSQSRTAPNVAPGFFRADLDGSDSLTYSATPIDPQPVNEDQVLVVVPRHSTWSATAQIEVGLYYESAGTYSFMGVADVQTSTSTMRTDATGYYPLAPLYFSLNGAKAYDLRCTDASGSTTVSLKAWTIGAASVAAE